MKKINTSIDPDLWAKWDDWKNSVVLKRAMSFPLEFIRNMTGAQDEIDDELKDRLEEYLRPDGLRRNYLLAVFRNSKRMTVELSEWMCQIIVTISLYEPGKKEPSFKLGVIFREGYSMEYQFHMTPTNFP